jgi:glycerophosphoryl diester phosphodiesterase/membrane-associated phospholipid phosphatase
MNPLDWGTSTFLLLILSSLGLRWWLMRTRRSGVAPSGEILLIAPAVLTYFMVRGLMNPAHDLAQDNAGRIIELEQRLGIFHEAAIQGFVLGSTLLTNVSNWIYIWAHWPFLALCLAWLIIFRFDAYPIYRNAILLSGAIGITFFLLFPVAPPRFIDEWGFVDTVTLQSNSYRVLQPPALMNQYAAMPSLHVGWNFLMGVALVRESRRWWLRSVGIVIPVAMWFATVATANHFVLDGLAGIVIAAGALSVSMTMARRGRASRRAEAEEFVAAYGRSRPPVAGGRGVPALGTLDVSRPFAIAHRHANDPHLLSAAREAGADVIEADLWLHRGQLELRHSKTLGPIPILWDRWSLERGWTERYTLRELLERAEDGYVLMLDLKGRNRDLPGRLVRELRRTPLNAPVLVCSQNWPLLEQLREVPEVRVVHSIGNWRQLREAWPRLERGEIDIVSIQFRLLSRETVRTLKRHASIVCSWPINSDERLQKALEWGVDGINSDELDIVRNVVRARVATFPMACSHD